MSLHISNAGESVFVNKYIFLDNDFLSLISKDPEAFSKTLRLTSGGRMIIDPITRLEFLRDTIRPEHRLTKSEFLDDTDIFAPATDSHDIFNQTRANALVLSYIFSRRKIQGNPSIPDLLLTARVMLYADTSLLITGNKKDFPNCVFDTQGALSFEEEKSGQLNTYSILSFSKEKFEQEIEALRKVQ